MTSLMSFNYVSDKKRMLFVKTCELFVKTLEEYSIYYIYSRYSSNFEAFASEYLANIKDILYI